MSVLNKNIVLVLNRNWQAIDTTTPSMAFCQMSTDVATGLDIQGKDWMVPVKWDDWLKLPVRGEDESIGTARGRVRVPTVIVLANFSKVPMKRPKFGRRGIWQRDGGRCQYTGRQLRPDEANLDHVNPRSRGGGDTWENIVLADSKVNTRKADRTPEEAGLTLLRKPERPQAKPSTEFIKNLHGVDDWAMFGISPEDSEN